MNIIYNKEGKKKYWLIGGISLSIISLVYFLFVMMMLELYIPLLNKAFIVIPIVVFSLRIFIFQDCFFSSFLGNYGQGTPKPAYCSYVDLSGILIALIFYFIIGSTIGLIYSKYKNREENKSCVK